MECRNCNHKEAWHYLSEVDDRYVDGECGVKDCDCKKFEPKDEEP